MNTLEALDVEIKQKNKELLSSMEEATRLRELSKTEEDKTKKLMDELMKLHGQYADLKKKEE